MQRQFFPGALILVILAEFFCAVSFAVGFLTRLAVIPLIINMLIAFFSHSGFNEVAFVYLMVFIVFFITGSGKYSVDSLLR
ncbi:MAG: DoxX family protein [Prevotellaceae bacterium]|nr:DoxX family protein [Prevotellaceae bacterium]